jgi:hypothetical protein
MRTGYTFLTSLSLLSLIQCASANFYLKDKWVGGDFFSWDWETEDDPTHGRVNYVSRQEAVDKRLAYGTVFPFASSCIFFRSLNRGFSGRNQVLHACGRSVHRQFHRTWA